MNENNRQFAHSDAIDLLDKMLRFDINERIRPREAMAHRYFDPVREFAKH